MSRVRPCPRILDRTTRDVVNLTIHHYELDKQIALFLQAIVLIWGSASLLQVQVFGDMSF